MGKSKTGIESGQKLVLHYCSPVSTYAQLFICGMWLKVWDVVLMLGKVMSSRIARLQFIMVVLINNEDLIHYQQCYIPGKLYRNPHSTLEVKFTTQHRQQYSNPQSTKQNSLWINSYIHTYIHDLRIAPHLLHGYLLFTYYNNNNIIY